MATLQLSLNPIAVSEIPSDDAVLTAAKDLLAQTPTWKRGKLHGKHYVQTLSRPKESGEIAPWHCRISEHSTESAAFDVMWDKLGQDGPMYEKFYIPNVKKATLVKRFSDTLAIWTMLYTFPPPVSPRVFTVLRFTYQSEFSPRTCTVVQIPVDLSGDPSLASLEERGTRGRYVSVERLLALENGKTEWRMATSGAPGGRIPSWITEFSMPGQIASDVGHFFTWLHSTADAKATAAVGATDAMASTDPAPTDSTMASADPAPMDSTMASTAVPTDNTMATEAAPKDESMQSQTMEMNPEQAGHRASM